MTDKPNCGDFDIQEADAIRKELVEIFPPPASDRSHFGPQSKRNEEETTEVCQHCWDESGLCECELYDYDDDPVEEQTCSGAQVREFLLYRDNDGPWHVAPEGVGQMPWREIVVAREIIGA